MKYSSCPIIVLSMLLCGLLTVGCSNSGDYVPVEGIVKLQGGSWPKPGAVFFTPKNTNEQSANRPCIGNFNTDGKFKVVSNSGQDGLPPGRYGVHFICLLQEPASFAGPNNGAFQRTSAVPLKYRNANTSGIELLVEPGSDTITLEYDLK